MSTDVSEEHVAFIFRVEEKGEQEIGVKADGKSSSKRRLTFSGLYDIICQKIELLIAIQLAQLCQL
jgi:hypothetical protein